jgi:eukaryotic-like serine/threonine-protein kinase
MKYLIITIAFLHVLVYPLFSQDITTDLGGPTHCGYYDTKPVNQLGTVLWTIPLDGWAQSNFIVKNNQLYVSANRYNPNTKTVTGFNYAIDVKKGFIVWKDSVAQNISSPTMKDSLLFYGSDAKPGKIYAFNSHSGKMIWSFETLENSCYPPAISGKSVYFGSHGNRWYELDYLTGQLLKESVSDTDICCSASVKNGMVYYVEFGKLHAYNTKTRSDAWTFAFDGNAFSAPAITDSKAFFVSEKGILYALDIQTGQLLWSFKTDDSMYRSPSINKSEKILTVITTKGIIYALNADNGKVLWQIQKSGKNNWPIYTHTAIVENTVYAGCADGFLYAFDLNSGTELWKFETGWPVGTPLIDQGTVYFTSGPKVYAIQ